MRLLGDVLNHGQAQRLELGLVAQNPKPLLVEQDAGFVRRASRRFAMMERSRVVAGDDINALTDKLVQRHMAV